MGKASGPQLSTLGSALCAFFIGAAALSAFTFVSPRKGLAGNPYRDFNAWINGLLFPADFLRWADDAFGAHAAHYFVCYVRDLIAGSFLYYAVALSWHCYIYYLRRDAFFPDGGMPTREVILDQVQLAQSSMIIYAGLPVLSEWFIEEGYTKAYYSMDEVGGPWAYAGLTLAYFSLVEVAIYWMHRKLHTNKTLYKYVHALHHKYNSSKTLSPWASVAFNPLDGILQACPYVIMLFVVPVHYLTHVILLFFTAVWATNIHDALHGDTEPVMGSKYHLVHHTHYHYNFGQVFVACDWMWGTLRRPEDIKNYKVPGAPKREKAA